MTIKVSIVIPVFNEEEYISDCIDSLLNQDYPPKEYEIIVVDNNSSDNTLRIVNKYKNVSVVTEYMRGASAARNKGIKLARGEIIAFVDGDTIIPRGWVNNILDVFKDNRRLGVVGGPDFTPEDDPHIAKIIGLTERSERNVKMVTSEQAAKWIKSCNCACSKEALERAGYFREDTQADFYFDETPVWLKMVKYYDALYDPKLFVFHRRRRSIRQYLGSCYRYGRSKAYLGYFDIYDLLACGILGGTLAGILLSPISFKFFISFVAVVAITLTAFILSCFYGNRNLKFVLMNLPVVVAMYYLKYLAWGAGIIREALTLRRGTK